MHSRDRLAFSKSILRRFIRDCVERDAAVASPWIVKNSIAVRYGVDTVMPEETRKNVDDLKKGESDKRKKLWEDKLEGQPPSKKQKKQAAAAAHEEEKGTPVGMGATGDGDPLMLVIRDPAKALQLAAERREWEAMRGEVERVRGELGERERERAEVEGVRQMNEILARLAFKGAQGQGQNSSRPQSQGQDGERNDVGEGGGEREGEGKNGEEGEGGEEQRDVGVQEVPGTRDGVA